ncbi:MAG TPA: hypothetical protein PK014_09380 [Thermoanaerobaculia bacterium]|nr:hypothetical protein [Thermoanaerobaculia bacterium]HUM30397.1 hypothetical protein [Thermoanaerobaculia bacterium]HXK68592.1 hypothetical protein [Thermoanaerobaculia bacterium]
MKGAVSQKTSFLSIFSWIFLVPPLLLFLGALAYLVLFLGLGIRVPWAVAIFSFMRHLPRLLRIAWIVGFPLLAIGAGSIDLWLAHRSGLPRRRMSIIAVYTGIVLLMILALLAMRSR